MSHPVFLKARLVARKSALLRFWSTKHYVALLWLLLPKYLTQYDDLARYFELNSRYLMQLVNYPCYLGPPT